MVNRLPGYSEEKLPAKFKPVMEERGAGVWCREVVKETGQGKVMMVKRAEERKHGMTDT